MALKLKAILFKICIGLAFIGLVHVSVFWYIGLHDHVQKADAIVILANTVNPDGSMSNRLKGRLDRGLQLYRANFAPLIIVSGGMGAEGYVIMKQKLCNSTCAPKKYHRNIL